MCNFFILLRELPIKIQLNRQFIRKYTHLLKNLSLKVSFTFHLIFWSNPCSVFFNSTILTKTLTILTPDSIIKSKRSIIFFNSLKKSSTKKEKSYNSKKIRNLWLSLETFKYVWILPKLILISKLSKEKRRNSTNTIKSSVFSNQLKAIKYKKSKKNDKIYKNSKTNFYTHWVVATFM